MSGLDYKSVIDFNNESLNFHNEDNICNFDQNLRPVTVKNFKINILITHDYMLINNSEITNTANPRLIRL